MGINDVRGVSWFFGTALVLTSLAPRLASAGDAIDTRVTFTVADNDLFRGPQDSDGGASTTGSPSAPNFVPNADNRLFFDDFERRDRGFENLTHFAIYGHKPGFFAGVDTEAALVIRAQVLSEDKKTGVALSDDGSYLTLSKQLADDMKLAVTAFPMSADRFRLGYSYDISWGGSAIFRQTRAAPGLRIQVETPNAWGFVGAKTGVRQMKQSDDTVETDTVWGVLAGGGIDVLDELRLEAGVGFFDRGVVDKEELWIEQADGTIATPPWQGYGGSVQLTYHVGLPIGTSVDFRLYRNDPLKQQEWFKHEDYNDDISFLIQTEASVLGQTLMDLSRPTSTTNQIAIAGDLAGRLKIDRFRFHLLAVFRTAEFILYNVPSLSPYVALPSGIRANPETFVSGGLDYNIEGWYLTLGLTGGVQFPAHVTAAPGPDDQIQKIILRDAKQWDLLDPGDKVRPIIAGKLTGRWDLSELLGLVGELQYSYDPNRRISAQDTWGIVVRKKTDPNILGFNLMMQGRF